MGAVLGIPESLIHPTNQQNEPLPSSEMDPRVFFRLATEDNEELGQVIFQLSARTHPQLSENFRLLCTGDKSFSIGFNPNYANTPLHAICPREGIIVGGDVVNRNGSGGHAATDISFTSRNASLPKEAGSLCMLNQSSRGVRFDSQFFILMKEVDHMDDGIAFGKVVQGLDVLQSVLTYGSENSIPRKAIIIKECGQM